MNQQGFTLFSILIQQMYHFQEQYKKDYVRYYVKRVYTKGPEESGDEYPVPVPGSTEVRDATFYRYFNIKKEMFLWEPSEQ